MERLKDLRLKRNLLQKDVATFLGIERTTYVKYENGISEPNYEMLKKIATYFNVSTDFLLEHNSQNLNVNFYSPEENALIDAYRAHPEMHDAVHRILGITEAEPNYRLVAFGGDNENKKHKSDPHIT